MNLTSPESDKSPTDSSKCSDDAKLPSNVSTLQEATTDDKGPGSSILTTPSHPKDAGKYLLVRTIGKGNFAKVKLAYHIATQVEVAIKIINKTQMKQNLIDRLSTEIMIMKKMNHPNVIRLLEIIETDDVTCLVMEYANGGEIFDYLVANGRMKEKEARPKFRQLVSAIHYCHLNNIVHRDLKAENILLDGNLNVKVADFGLANAFNEGNDILRTFCGSPPYAAPELFIGIPYYAPCVDIWSLGVILFTLVVGHLPFEANSLRELRNKILRLEYSFKSTSVSTELKELISMMLVLDPRHRTSLNPIMNHRWTNIDFENQPLILTEPETQPIDAARVKALTNLGYTEEQIHESVLSKKFDHIYASYHLLPSVPSTLPKMSQEFNSDTVTQQTQITLPHSIVRGDAGGNKAKESSPAKSTNVGRFTVIKAIEAESVNLSSSNTTPAQIDSGNQYQSYSYTSSMPLYLKKAFSNFGRNLMGNSEPANSGFKQSLSREERHSTSLQSPHAKNKQYYDQKQTQKKIQNNPYLTTSPVPMNVPIVMKKSNPHATKNTLSTGNHQQLEANNSTWHSGNSASFQRQMTMQKQQSQKITRNSSNKSLLGASPKASDNKLNSLNNNLALNGSNDLTQQRSINEGISEDADNVDSGEKTPVMGSLNNESEGIEPLEKTDAKLINNSKTEQAPNRCSNFMAPKRFSLCEPRKGKFFKNFLQQPKENVNYQKPRCVVFTWSVSTTSSKPADILLEEVVVVLKKTEGIRFVKDKNWRFLIHCGFDKQRNSFDQESLTLMNNSEPIKMPLQLDENDPIMFEIEVCLLPRLSLHGIRVKRIRGAAMDFQKIAKSIINAMSL